MARRDVVVVGGGIVGLATAMALAEEHRMRPLVLEAEDAVGLHQSSRNSGVVHSGLYYRPGSLKAELCASGRVEMEAFCRAEGIPYDQCGKLVVATRDSERPALDELARRGAANGVTGIERVDAAAIRQHEPHCAGLAGLWIPTAAVTDFGQVTAAMARRVVAAGGEVRTGSRLIGLAWSQDRAIGELTGSDTGAPRQGRPIGLVTPKGIVEAEYLVACAGLHADRVSRMCGVDPGVRIVPFRGDYYELVPERRALVRGLIYPVPDPNMPFLGVHLTRGVDGSVEVGPSAVLALRREGYRRTDASAGDVADMARYAGFWRMARRHWRTGIAETRRAVSKAAFAAEVRRLVPAISPHDLRPAPSGVRAQALLPDGTFVDDFLFAEAARMTHVLSAPSPAATASIAIGRHVAKRVADRYSTA